jgi:hypothetical protein
MAPALPLCKMAGWSLRPKHNYLTAACGAKIGFGTLQRVRTENSFHGHKTAALRIGFIADCVLIPMVANGVTRSSTKSALSGTGGQVPAEVPADEPTGPAR